MANGTEEFKRFQEIDKFFSSGNKATVEELSKYLDSIDLEAGCSVKILYKVLKSMKVDMEAPIVKDSDGRYYYEKDSTLTVPGFLTRRETFKILRIMNNLLETIKGTPIYDEAVSLYKDFSLFSPAVESCRTISNPAENASNRVIFLGAPASDVKDDIWTEIYRAMENNYYISIEYASTRTETIERKGIKPYQLIYDNGIWDLWGFDCIKKEKKLFNLSRIKKLEVRTNDEKFDLPENYDFRNETPGTFGCFVDNDTKDMSRYKISFKPNSYAAFYAKERVWGKNFVLTENEEETIIEFDDNQYLPILRWVLGWGSDVRPLAPEKLVEDWKKNIREIYNSKDF